MRWQTLWLAALVVACGSDGATSKETADSADETAPTDTVTWSGGARAVVSAHCAGCQVEGGPAPFALRTWADAAPLADVLVAAVDAGRMPPWSPDPDCRSFEHERVRSAEDAAVLRAWAEGGALEGDPVDPIAPESVTLSPDLVLAPETSYTPDFSTTADDYRCQFLDHTFAEETWLSASQVSPGSAEVHHVLIYALTGEQIDLAVALDEEDDTPGYSCFSGPVPSESGETPTGGLPGQVGAWVPGANPLVLEDGEAIRVPAGARVVMQVHYSAQGTDPTAATTTLGIVRAETEPEKLLVTRPLPVMDFEIPAGEASFTATQTFTNWSTDTMRLRTVAAHMHLLGQRQEVRILGADGADTCVLDIPDWDFSWQQAYSIPRDEVVEVRPGDAVEVSCTWDNSEANQPVVDGELAAPETVTWGEGTADEMCVSYLGVVEAYSPAPDPNAPACDASCDPEDSFDTLLSCDAMSATCLPCTFDSFLACTQAECGAELFPMQDCMQSCGLDTFVLGGAPGDCLHATCPDDYAALLACADPVLQAGTCDAVLSSCGL